MMPFNQALIDQALQMLEDRMRYGAQTILSSPQAVKEYLRLLLGGKEHEVFTAIFTDAKNCLLETQEMFRGTLTQTSVYPREIVKAALACNAAAVILAHNHPSGNKEPSTADRLLTRTLKDALKLVDVQVLDHIVVTTTDTYSFAEHGII